MHSTQRQLNDAFLRTDYFCGGFLRGLVPEVLTSRYLRPVGLTCVDVAEPDLRVLRWCEEELDVHESLVCEDVAALEDTVLRVLE